MKLTQKNNSKLTLLAIFLTVNFCKIENIPKGS